jgi:ubiquinone/menaquinone biosynthesis C-methylase UbiE
MTDTITTHSNEDHETPREHHVCPVWVGRLLVSPIRRLFENPGKILGPYVTPGSTVVDVGCAMGFHSLDLARHVGPEGRVVCLDIQQKMLDGLVKRARRKGLEGVIEPRLCSQDGFGLDDIAGTAELVMAFNVVHETTYPSRFIRECANALAPGGRLLIAEPSGHVSADDFKETISTAVDLGLERYDAPAIRKCRTALFSKPRAENSSIPASEAV